MLTAIRGLALALLAGGLVLGGCSNSKRQAALPPDPGPAGELTVTGVDSNGNGIRDDVERYIALAHPEAGTAQASLTQLAAAMQRAATVSDDATALTVANERDDAVDCVVDTFGRSRASLVLEAILPVQLNTAARVRTESAFLDRLGSQLKPIGQRLPGATCRQPTASGRSLSRLEPAMAVQPFAADSYALIYVNGIRTSRADAQQDATALCDAVGPKSLTGSAIQCYWLYNPTQGTLFDVAEVIEQKLVDYPGAKFADLFAAYITRTLRDVLVPYREKLLLDVTAYWSRAVSQPSVSTQADAMQATVRLNFTPGHRILFAPHSQGNLYVNTVVDGLSRGVEPFPAGTFGVMGIANPDYRVAPDGADGAPCRDAERYVTSHTDGVINALRAIAPTTLPGNLSISPRTSDLADHLFDLGHNLVDDYLDPARQGRTVVIGKIQQALGRLTSAPVAAQLAVTTQPLGGVSGGPLSTKPIVEVQNAAGLVVAQASNQVTASLASGTGTLSGTTTVAAVNGSAAFLDLSVTGTGPFVLRFTSPGLTEASSLSFDVRSGVATVSVSPASGPMGTVFSAPGFGFTPHRTVTLHLGMPDGSELTAVTVADGAGGYPWTHDSATSDQFGPHSYWAIDDATNARSNTVIFQVTRAASIDAVQLATTLVPLGGTVQYTASLTNWTPSRLSSVVLQGWIQQGTSLRAAGGVVALCAGSQGDLQPGTCSMQWTLVAANDGAGSGTLVAGSALAVLELKRQPIGAREELLDAFTVPITLTVADRLVITAQPNGAVSGQPMGLQPVVEVGDAAGRRVAGTFTEVTASIASGIGTLSGATTVYAGSGAAVFTGLAITGTGPVAIAFTAPGLAGVTSRVLVVVNPAVSVTPSGGARGTVFSQPGSGFTPNGAVTLHFRKPDLTQAMASTSADASGRYAWSYASSLADLPGTYSYWAVDEASGATSNTASFQLTQPVTHGISGAVTGAVAGGVRVVLGGTGSGTATTSGSGTYSFTSLADGSYTLTPSMAGYTFSPNTLAVSISGSDVTVQEFVATAIGSGWVAISAGDLHTVAMRGDGTLWAWGDNTHGQVGDGTTTQRNSPVQIGSGYASVAAGDLHTVAVKADGTLWAWGDNTASQIGDGTTTQRNVPVQIGSGYAAVAAGWVHSLGVKTDGTLWAWGGNAYGQLGDGTVTLRNVPVQVGVGYASVTAGRIHTVGLKADGTLWSWGDNAVGQLGDGTTTSQRSSVLVGGGYASVAAGASFCVAVRTDGTLWGWGDNAFGQVGDGTTTSRSSPVLVGGGYASVAARSVHAVAVRTDGTLWAWGYNYYGLGDGTRTQRDAPVQVGSGYALADAGYYHTVAMKSDRTLWAWGNNGYGQLGDGTTTEQLAPMQIP
jgi:alpha-tubulin suppressor-like RCC1 family protein